MNIKKILKIFIILLIPTFILNACNGKLPGADARKYPKDPEKRVQQNLKEGRGFRLNDAVKGFTENKGGVFDFASANELWRASLDTIDFMPLSSVNYSGGIIITDWYADDANQNESIKISIRFLTNEIRSDALDIKVFNRKCSENFQQCVTKEVNGVIAPELKRKILKTAAIYKSQKENKKE
jgi:hypothetical protein